MEATIKKSSRLILGTAIFALAVFLLPSVSGAVVKESSQPAVTELPVINLHITSIQKGYVEGSFIIISPEGGSTINASYEIRLSQQVNGGTDKLVDSSPAEKFSIKPITAQAFNFTYNYSDSLPSGKYDISVVTLTLDSKLIGASAKQLIELEGDTLNNSIPKSFPSRNVILAVLAFIALVIFIIYSVFKKKS